MSRASLRVGVGARRMGGVGSRLARGVCSRRVGVASRLVGVGSRCSRLVGAPRSLLLGSFGISTSSRCRVGVGSRLKGTSRRVGVGSRLVGVGCRLVGVIASLRVLGSRFGVASRRSREGTRSRSAEGPRSLRTSSS